MYWFAAGVLSSFLIYCQHKSGSDTRTFLSLVCQILETIPISDEVSDLVQKLDNFFMEVDNDEEENDMNIRSFTRPFTQHAGNPHL